MLGSDVSERDLVPDDFEPLAPDYAADLFSGTAHFYSQYRVPYSDALLDDLCVRADVTGTGRLVDLACGPGRVALPLAGRFAEVVATDQEPEMVEVGRADAVRLGIENVRWEVGRAEDLELDAASTELITIGEAFHRLDQRVIGAQALAWLEPGGHIASLGCYGLTTGSEPWQQIIRDVLNRWADADRMPRRSRPVHRARGAAHDGQVLCWVGFEEVRDYQFLHPHEWTPESIIGNLYSGSGNLSSSLGQGRVDFEAELTKALLEHDSKGTFLETMRFGYTLGMRPG
jgi:SAM-dependent methyltransferase